MGWRFTELPYLMNTAPDELKALIIKVLDSNEGHMINSAADLGIERRMLQKYIARLGMRAEADGIKDKWSVQRRVSRSGRSQGRRGGAKNEFVEAASLRPDETRQTIRWAFEEAAGVPSEVAKILGVPRSTFWNVTRKLGLYDELMATLERMRAERAGSAFKASGTEPAPQHGA